MLGRCEGGVFEEVGEVDEVWQRLRWGWLFIRRVKGRGRR